MILPERHTRQEWLFGKESTALLRRCHVAVFGLGGVGSYAVEALARSGIGTLTLVDGDVFSPSNLNRQLYATEKTLGRSKADVAAERVREIDGEIRVFAKNAFVLPENIEEFDFGAYDLVLDAVDTVAAKLAIAEAAQRAGCLAVSCMGAGNKTDPTRFQVADIYETDTCPLARAVRIGCRKRGISRLRVVYSKEPPAEGGAQDGETGRPLPGSCAFVPSVAGLILAGEGIRLLLSQEGRPEK